MTDFKKKGLILHYTVLLLGAIIFIMPLVWLISGSLKSQADIVCGNFFPSKLHWENYKKAVSVIPFFRYALNTLTITILSIIGACLANPFVGFSFARLNFPAKNLLFILVLSTMMLPPQVTMIPLFIIFRNLGWVNTFKPLWVITFFGSAFFIFLSRQYLKTLPQELIDAAKIDGCNYWQIYWKIIVPLLRPLLITIVIFQFIASWNDFMGPLIYLNSEKLMTLSVGLQVFQSNHSTDLNLLMAASTLMTLPIIIIFVFFQNYMVENMTLSGIKG